MATRAERGANNERLASSVRARRLGREAAAKPSEVLLTQGVKPARSQLHGVPERPTTVAGRSGIGASGWRDAAAAGSSEASGEGRRAGAPSRVTRWYAPARCRKYCLRTTTPLHRVPHILHAVYCTCADLDLTWPGNAAKPRATDNYVQRPATTTTRALWRNTCGAPTPPSREASPRVECFFTKNSQFPLWGVRIVQRCVTHRGSRSRTWFVGGTKHTKAPNTTLYDTAVAQRACSSNETVLSLR